MNLVEEYPLAPQYPFFGEHLILIWWTPEKQHHAIVVTSEESLLLSWRMVQEQTKHNLPQARALWKGVIVGPTAEMALTYAKQEYEKELREFRCFTLDLLCHDLEETTILAKGFTPCPQYDPDPEWLSEEDQQDSYTRECHMYCRCCNGDRILPQTTTWAQLFERGRDLYRSYQSTPLTKAVRIPSNAPKADPNKPVLVAQNDEGNHRNGFILRTTIEDLLGPILFFFQGEEQPLPQGVLDIAAEFKSRAEAAVQQRKLSTETRRAEHRTKKREMLTRLLEMIVD